MRATNLVQRGCRAISSNVLKRSQARLLSSPASEADAVVREKMFYDAVIVGAGTRPAHTRNEKHSLVGGGASMILSAVWSNCKTFFSAQGLLDSQLLLD